MICQHFIDITLFFPTSSHYDSSAVLSPKCQMENCSQTNLKVQSRTVVAVCTLTNSWHITVSDPSGHTHTHTHTTHTHCVLVYISVQRCLSVE